MWKREGSGDVENEVKRVEPNDKDDGKSGRVKKVEEWRMRWREYNQTMKIMERVEE